MLNDSLIVMISYIYIVPAILEQFTNNIHKRVTLPILKMPPSLSWRQGSKHAVDKEQISRGRGILAENSSTWETTALMEKKIAHRKSTPWNH